MGIITLGYFGYFFGYLIQFSALVANGRALTALQLYFAAAAFTIQVIPNRLCPN